MIKKLKNNFTTPEQSKRLLELGVPVDSADMKYWEGHRITDDDIPILLMPGIPYSKSNMEFNSLPCWTVGRLFEIYNKCIDKEKADKEDITKECYKLCLEEAYNHEYVQYMIDCFYFAYDFKLLDLSKLEED